MTIISGSEFRANQSKYIGMANNGERVVLSSKAGYAELKPVSQNDKDVRDYLNSRCFVAIANKVRQEYKDGKAVSCNTPDEIKRHLLSL